MSYYPTLGAISVKTLSPEGVTTSSSPSRGGRVSPVIVVGALGLAGYLVYRHFRKATP